MVEGSGSSLRTGLVSREVRGKDEVLGGFRPGVATNALISCEIAAHRHSEQGLILIHCTFPGGETLPARAIVCIAGASDATGWSQQYRKLAVCSEQHL